MNVKIPVKEIDIHDQKFTLILKNHAPVVEWSNKEFPHLWFLLEKCPLLSQEKHINDFATIANFFWKGLEFECISSISHFQKNYKQRVELEKDYPADVFPYRLTDYKIFNISVMHEPRIENGELFFFVYRISNGLPFRVVCPFPYPTDSIVVHYQILPIVESAH